jgi:hypothetical protein
MAKWTWNTAGLLPGTYKISVWANQSGDPTSNYESFAQVYMSLNGCGSGTVNLVPASPQKRGAWIKLTATATVCPKPLYEFWMMAPGSSVWQAVQAYNTKAILNWNTTGNLAGTYNFLVWVRDANSGGATGNSLGRWDAVTTSSYTLT